jgi:heme/copper-type cytochrome/quinol oxidase subunit 3
MAMLILTESMIFIGLAGAYFFLRAASKTWPPPGVELPDLRNGVIFSIVLWSSSIPVIWAESGIKKGNQRRLLAGLIISFVMGAAFMLYAFDDFEKLHFGWRDHAYGSIFYTTVGLHTIHLGIGLAMSLVVQAKVWMGKITRERHQTVEIFSLYWHFVDGVWVLVFGTFFLSPHIR